MNKSMATRVDDLERNAPRHAGRGYHMIKKHGQSVNRMIAEYEAGGKAIGPNDFVLTWQPPQESGGADA